MNFLNIDPAKLSKIIRIVVILVVVILVGVAAYFIYIYFISRPGTVSPPSAKTKIQIWGLWENKEVYQPVFDAFIKENPTVEIEYINRETTDDNVVNYKSKLIARLNEKSADALSADIFMINNTWTNQLQTHLSPMDSVNAYLVNDYKNSFYPTVYESFKGTDGKVYAIPFYVDGIGLYYNKKLLKDKGYDKPQTDWDQFREQAKKLTTKDSKGAVLVAGAGIGTMKNVEFSYEILSLLMLQNGAKMTAVDTKTNVTSSTFGTDLNAAKALKFYADFTTVDKIWNATLPTDVQMFAEGRLAMMFAPLWRADSLKKTNKDLDFDIAPVPQLSGLDLVKRIDIADYYGFAVSRYSKNQALSWKLLKYMSSSDSLRSYYDQASKVRLTGEMYPRSEMASLLTGKQYVDAYVKMSPTFQNWNHYNKEAVSDLFKNIIDEDLVKTNNLSLSNASNLLKQISLEVDKLYNPGSSSSTRSSNASSKSTN